MPTNHHRYRRTGLTAVLLVLSGGSLKLDLGHVVIVGHSAGGHLAMWAAARSRVPKGSPL